MRGRVANQRVRVCIKECLEKWPKSQLCNKWGTIVWFSHFDSSAFIKFYNGFSLVLNGCQLMKLSKHTNDLRTFQSEKKKSEIGTEMFSQDSRKKQMRDLKAKPAVSTLKTVHTNYFPEGVSTLFPLCCQRSHRFNCRRAFSLLLLGNAQHPISILISSRSIIPPLSSI